jgi:hypothetical protein
MGSGKTLMMCFLSAHKMKADKNLRTIIAVPQTIIAPGFSEAALHNATFGGKILDVGVDAVAAMLSGNVSGTGNISKPEHYRPLSFEEMRAIMKKKEFEAVDHHR